MGKASFHRARPHAGSVRLGEQKRLFLDLLFRHCGDSSFGLPFFVPIDWLPAVLQPPSSCLVVGVRVSLSFWSPSFLVASLCRCHHPAFQEGPSGLLGHVQQRTHRTVQSPVPGCGRGSALYMVSPSDRDCGGRYSRLPRSGQSAWPSYLVRIAAVPCVSNQTLRVQSCLIQH